MVRDNHHVSRRSRADGCTQCFEDYVWRGVLRLGLLVEPPLGIQYHYTDAVFIHNNGPRLTAPRQKTHLCLKKFAIHIFLLSLNSLQAETFAPLPIMIAWNKNAFYVTVLDRRYLGIEPLSRLCILVLLSFLRQALRVAIITEKENGSLLGVCTRSRDQRLQRQVLNTGMLVIPGVIGCIAGRFTAISKKQNPILQLCLWVRRRSGKANVWLRVATTARDHEEHTEHQVHKHGATHQSQKLTCGM